MASSKSKSAFFIPGAWMTPECWDNFRKTFEAAGYRTDSKPWPYLDGPAAALRDHPPEALGGLTVGRIVDHYAAIISALPEPPVIVGHSFGGLYVQLLLDRGIGRSGIAIDPGPIAWALPGPQSLLAALPPILRWKGWARPFLISREGFARNFANTLPPEAQKAAYDKYVVPTSGMIFHQAAASVGTGASPRKRRQPLLITAAQYDRTVTPYLSRVIYHAQKHAPSRTDFKYYKGLSHSLIFEPGWEAVAKDCLDWSESVGADSV
jgi:pimeloyl-ACP methyl ester carboxylesterase